MGGNLGCTFDYMVCGVDFVWTGLGGWSSGEGRDFLEMGKKRG
jgi:hypothetical protein